MNSEKIAVKQEIGMTKRSVKLVLYGEEVVEKRIKASGNSGRIYLPQEWVGSRVKIVRLD